MERTGQLKLKRQDVEEVGRQAALAIGRARLSARDKKELADIQGLSVRARLSMRAEFDLKELEQKARRKARINLWGATRGDVDRLFAWLRARGLNDIAARVKRKLAWDALTPVERTKKLLGDPEGWLAQRVKTYNEWRGQPGQASVVEELRRSSAWLKLDMPTILAALGVKRNNPRGRKSDRLRDMDRPTVLGYELDKRTLTPKRTFIDVHATGDYGADPLGDGRFKMVPSGDVVTLEERNRRLGKNPRYRRGRGRKGAYRRHAAKYRRNPKRKRAYKRKRVYRC